ncbi:membrane protein DedA, SNARE-associated domain [Granulicella pectinivorans]|uniref:Membrane protein DedA, SNARE-associated domain n=1 Tax=Granulicella pectinivorans TaxID=474950 RepID=A0A1I6MYJ3_9BACT|nr:VTT domain-containing protein [Granulicella pectinivorans]SFS20717.1 membrane protein DedA, SNARE-associated domain [Granulicella pectinivorans]
MTHPLAILHQAAAPGSILASLAPAHHHSNPLLHLFLSLGIFGIFLVSIVDSSFIPLPIPGLTDIMIVVVAAQRDGWLQACLLVFLATFGSAIGGFVSYQVGQSGGMAFLEKRVPPRVFKRVTQWMEDHNILAVALPAILPPPMPLSPFVLAAGALRMSREKFMWTFTLSRLGRHIIALWLGIHYGKQVLSLWAKFSQRWAVPFLVTLWSVIIVFCVIAFVRIYKTSKSVNVRFRQPAA